MDLSVHAFGAAKKGNDADEYEDAYCFSIADGRFALADGATESSFADAWARSLVEEFAQSPPGWTRTGCEDLPTWLEPLQTRWRKGIHWDRLPWYAEEKAHRGAFATLVAVEFMRPGAEEAGLAPESWWHRFKGWLHPGGQRSVPHWRALAVGDSCFFQVRERQLVTAFPLGQACQFDSRPYLLGSNPAANRALAGELRVSAGFCEPNDLFILASDALAQWILQIHETGGDPWSGLEELHTRKAFLSFVTRCRQEGKLKNDDTTMLLFRWPESA